MRAVRLAALLTLAGCYRPPAPLVTGGTPAEAPAASPAPVEPLSCEAAATAAIKAHPNARVARARALLDAARADVAGGLENPEIRGRLGTPEPVERARLGLRFELPVPGRLAALRAAADGERDESEAERAEVDVEIAATARQLHITVRREREQVAWREKQVELETAARALADRRVQAGIASRVVLDTAELSLLDARDDLAEVRGDLRRAEAAFTAWTGATVGPGACAAPPESAAEHPALQAARARRVGDHGQAEADARESWFWPSFFEVHWDPRDTNPDRILFEMGLPIPLFGGDDAPDPAVVMALADAELQATQADVARAQSAARVAVAAAEARITALGKVEPPALDQPPATLEQLELWRLQHRLAGRSIRVRYALESARADLRRALGVP